MALLEKCSEAANEISRIEAQLKEEDLSEYTNEGLDFEKSEFTKAWTKYKKLYEECSSELSGKELVVVQSKHQAIRKAQAKCINIIAKARKNISVENGTQNTVGQTQGFSVPVPPCDTGVFQGDYVSWPTFRDMFTAIFINNTRLSPVEKLFYLFQKTNGEAREINRNIALTAENFDIAWNNLKCQYENKRVLVNSQLKLLFNLAPCQQETAQEVKRLQREINNSISVLKLYNIDIESWDPIFVFQCSSRLSEQTLNLWEQSVKNKTEVPRWKELDEFLTDRFHALESVSDIMANNIQWPSGSQIVSHKNLQNSSNVKQLKAHHTKVDITQCNLCKEDHKISSCQKFLKMDTKTRASVLKKFRYCFNCLTIGHMYNDCPSQNGCSTCKKKHHNLLHREFKKNINQQYQTGNVAQNNAQRNQFTKTQSTGASGPSGVVQTHHTVVAKKVMLATAWINIMSSGSAYKARALIDPCSDESFVSEKTQKLLKLPTVPVSAEVTGLGGEVVSKSNKMATFKIVSIINPDFSLEVEALVVSQVTGNVPTHSFNPSGGREFPKLDYADPDFYKSGPIDILLGGDLYPLILRGGVQHGIFESLVAQETVFGWIMTGPTIGKDYSRNTRMSHFTSVSIDEQLSKFWELEEVYRKPLNSEEDRKCEDIYRSTTVRNTEGRYVVNLPFKDNCPSLGPNRHIALRQFLRNEKSLLRKPEYKIQYDEVLQEYLTLAHMERVDPETSGLYYYLPHHGVFKPDSVTTKLRVVFNGSSASSNGQSLNDNLLVGPTLQRDLVSLMLKWRFFEFVFSADITKMYRQILINPDHARFQRIIFRSSENEELQDFQLKTVTFGINCAPYLALRTLLQLADDEEQRFPIGSKILRDSLYVDDALVGAPSISDALVARNQLIGILKSAGFELRKWTSNSRRIIEDLPSDHWLDAAFLCLEDKSIAKMLGVRWNAASDNFYFVTERIQVRPSYTKREVLSIIARLFDPAGWLAPVIVTAKILMQQMWLDKIGWDEPITTIAFHKWQTFVSKFNEIDTITIPRWIKYTPECSIQLHGFCDSSELAYAASLYARVRLGNNVVSNLLVSKTKVAPIKKISLPRLELCGATLLAYLIESVKSQFDINSYELYLWSDSTIVLAWLRKSPGCWKTFVANRVSIILDKVGNTNWSHVASHFNPADLATRGLTPSELEASNLWWHGPEWLTSEQQFWPTRSTDFQTSVEEKRVQVHVTRSSEREDILERFSCLSKAIHVIAYMFRFFTVVQKKLKTAERPVTARLSAEELTFAKNRLFLLSQKIYFPDEYNCLKRNTKIDSHSSLLTLTPFLDKWGIIRANGRLGSTTSLSYNERHPVILAYGSRLARLYVEFIHRLTHHGGSRLVLNTVRQECWILKAKNLIKTIIHNCKPCVLHRKKLQGQIMAALPEERTTFSRPFTNTGVDFAGPFEIKSFTGRYSKITKGYACLFVCLSTKAIHLEAVSDLSTPAFLAALARFVARRGCPNKMFSDNGRNFVGAAREIDTNFTAHVKELRDEAVSKYGHQRLSWHFIPAAAPHMGGLWEAGVKSFKTHLKKLSGQLKYTFEEFSTLLATIESCLNSRPLGPLSDNSEDSQALTPAHFLIGASMLSPAEPEDMRPAGSILNRWRKLKVMHQELCRRWKEEYLKELHKRNKWKHPQIDLEEGDLVVLKNEPTCSTEWRLGRVVKLYRGSDNRVRVVGLKTQNGLISRPIHKLVLLPRSS